MIASEERNRNEQRHIVFEVVVWTAVILNALLLVYIAVEVIALEIRALRPVSPLMVSGMIFFKLMYAGLLWSLLFRRALLDLGLFLAAGFAMQGMYFTMVSGVCSSADPKPFSCQILPVIF